MHITEHGPQKARERVVLEDQKENYRHKHVKGKVYKTLCKQLDVPVTAVTHIFQKFKVYRTVANLLDMAARGKLITNCNQRVQNNFHDD